MKIIGHMVKDMDTFHMYFADDAPNRPLMFFIENHTVEVFTGRLDCVPQGFLVPLVDGTKAEAAVIADIMDITGEEPTLHVVLETIEIDAETKGASA
jgi:hypothetical protein